METLVRQTTVLQNLAFWVLRTQLQLKAGSITSTATQLLLPLDPGWPRLSCHRVSNLRSACTDIFQWVEAQQNFLPLRKCKFFTLPLLPIRCSYYLFVLELSAYLLSLLRGIFTFYHKIWSKFSHLPKQFHVARLFNYNLFQDPPTLVERLICFITCDIRYVHEMSALVTILPNCKILCFCTTCHTCT